MEKLWIVSELFYPEETSTSYLLTKIANAMSNKYDVNVICCNGKYDKEKCADGSMGAFWRGEK